MENFVLRFQRLHTLLWLLVPLLILGGCGRGHKFTALVSDPPVEVTGFSLTGADGSIFNLEDLRGSYILLDFGYTHCPDVCPMTLAQLRVAREKLGADADKVKVVFISVDPERDNAELLRNYAHAFAADFIGVTGQVAEIDRACAEFGARYKLEKTPGTADPNYDVSHTAYVYVIDPSFHLRLTIPFGAQADEIASDLQALMAE